ncbi:bactericidal permeability-increasing protein-like [Mytilus trossulus]|uniref:bactericidal permeability-increasing protein-like n=1 Tax=Mytilus trossulus TaxID=6551 RepID=UPI003007531E
MSGHEANNSQLKNLAERLLQQDIKDHEGASGSLFYKFTGMKIQNAKLPQASMVAGRLQTRNGAICINGNYSLFYDGILKRTADGDFTVMISDMAVSLEDVRSARNRGRDGRDSVDHDLLHRLIRNGVCVCKIGKIKAKFQGGSAGLCLFFFRILVKFMRNSLEEQAAQVVKKMLKDEEDMAVIGLIALFAFSEDQLPEEPPRRGIRRYIASCAPGTRTRH